MASYGAGPARPGPAAAGPWAGLRPPGPPRRSRNGLVFGLCAGLVTVVVAIVVIAAILTSSGGRLHRIWTVQKPDQVGEATTVMAYPTTDGETFVRVSLNGAVGYDLATGRTRWRLAVPKGTRVCASTHGVPGKTGALVYGAHSHCTTATAFDVTTGRRLWTTTLPVHDSSDPPDSSALAVAGSTVYVSNTQRIVGYDSRLGTKGNGQAAPSTAAPSAGCRFDGVAATTARVVTIEACGESRRFLVGLDPKTLHVAFRTPLQLERGQQVHVVSVSPLVLHATNALDNGELRLFDDAGRQTKVFSSRQHEGVLVLRSATGGGYRDDNVGFPVRVVGDTLVARLDEDELGDQRRVAGIDVRRGRWAWTSSLDTPNDVVLASGGDTRKATVFAEGGYGSGFFGGKERPHVLEVDPASGEVTKGDELDVGDDTPSLFSASVFVVGRKVVIVRVVTSYDAPLVTAYGP